MGGGFLERWTRTQRIRTAAAVPVAALILDAGSTPTYLHIGEKAAHLRELGMSDRAIARAIGVSDKTVAKSLRQADVGNVLQVVPHDESDAPT